MGIHQANHKKQDGDDDSLAKIAEK